MPRLASTAGCYVEDPDDSPSGERCGRKIYGHRMCSRHYTRWHRYGDPLGKARRPTLEERFWAKVDKGDDDECWPWTATITPAGYGQIGLGSDVLFAHRVSYELNTGSIPDGYEIDHLCHTRDEACRLADRCPHRRCVNPDHLEAVPPLVNVMRSRCPQADNARKTECDKGHPFDEANTYIAPNGSRNCRACAREEAEERKAGEQMRRALGLPPPTPAKKECRAHHVLVGDNVGIASDGSTYCRTCKREQDADRKRQARMSRPPRVLKLSDDDVARIRQQWAAGGVTKRALADEYGVTFAYISGIVRGKMRLEPVEQTGR